MNPPDHISSRGEYEIIRERILQTLLVVVGIVTLIGLVALTINNFIQSQYLLALAYIGLGAVILAFVIKRDVAFDLRAGIVLITFLATALVIFWRDGLGGNGKLYLLTFTSLTTLLLGWKSGLGAVIFSEIGISISGYLVVNHLVYVSPDSGLINSVDGSDWIVTCIFFAILSTILSFSLSMMINSLQTAYNRVNRLSLDLSEERAGLQDRVEKRTIQIQQRLRQVLTAAEISKTIVSYRETETLLPQIVNLIRERFDLYYVGAFIVDDNNNAVLRAGTGQAGNTMIAAGHRLAVGGSSMIGWAIANRNARVSQEVVSEAVRFINPQLPLTRSELAIPIISRNQGLGALTIQSDQPDAFAPEDIQILQGIADSLAIALENSDLFNQAQDSLDEVRSMNREYLRQAWQQATNVSGSLSYTFENSEAAGGTPASVVQIPLSLRDQVIGQITLETDSPNLTPAQMEFIDAITTQTALALENARLLNETQQRAMQEQTLNELTAEFSRAISMEDILKSAIRQLGHLPTVQEISVQLVSSSNPAPAKGSNGHNGNGKEAHS